MNHLARKHQQDPEVSQTLGTVTDVENRVFTVETETRIVRARRATSCLLEPAVGDVVIVATLEVNPRALDQHAYVLAVLEREAGAPGAIVAEGDLAIKLPRGALAITTQEGVHMVTPQDVSVTSGALQVNTVDADVATERFTFLSSLVRAQVGKAKVFGTALEGMFDRVVERVKRSYRIVESDHVRAEQIDYSAKHRLSLHGENTVVTAETLAKVEGDQIHLG